MLRIFYADLRNALHNKGFRIACFTPLFYSGGITILLWVILKVFLKDGGLTAEDVLDNYNGLAAFLITAATMMVFSGDFSNGIIRNKLISGAKRKDVAMSCILCGALMGVLLCAVYVVVSVLFVTIFTEGLQMLTIAEAADSCLVFTLASMSVGAFSAMLVLVSGGSKISYAIGLVIAFVFKLLNLEVCEKLYPEKGLCALQGAKLMLYRGFDRFVPYSHFSLYTRWQFADYLIGSVVLIVLSLVIGILLFQKKEIK